MQVRNPVDYYDGCAGTYDLATLIAKYEAPRKLFGLVPDGHIFSGQKVLDVACGTGCSAEPFKAHYPDIRIFGVDGAANMLECFRKKGIAEEIRLANLLTEPIPYDDGQFDHVICNGFFDFFENITPLFQEVGRVIKEEGLFCFTFEELKPGMDRKIIRSMMEVFRQSAEEVLSGLRTSRFSVLNAEEFFAFKSVCFGSEVFFTGVIAQKK